MYRLTGNNYSGENMRLISTKTHAVLDYVVGLALAVSPWLFGFASTGSPVAIWLPVLIGVMTLLMSLVTDYELSLRRTIPMSLHLWVDILGGLLLAASPWLFGFVDLVFVPHFLFGTMEVVVALITEKQPSYSIQQRPVGTLRSNKL
jgi:hypothetical protein